LWRRLNREDLVNSNPLLGGAETDGRLVWRVYEDYEVRRAEDGTRFVEMAGRGTAREAATLEVYEPITDTPHLFLEFARLVESKYAGEALLDWVHRYGLLGFSYEGVWWPPGDPLQQSTPKPFHDDKGGTLDNFENIWSIAWEANQSLLLYEAAIGGDERKLEQVLFSGEDEEWANSQRRRWETRAEATGASYRDTLINAALFQLTEYAHGTLISYCYPVISCPLRYSHIPEDDAPPMTPGQLSRGWGARNLLGAMGLQLYWLVTSGGELHHCKYCGRIISHTSSIPGGALAKDRKTRSDKTFCDKRCRQNYHYHNRRKGQRKGESNGVGKRPFS
jgi:hypothetical protein